MDNDSIGQGDRRLTKLTFIHAADLHLDSPFAGMSTIPSSIFKRLKESTFQSAKNIFDLAVAREVDFVLLIQSQLKSTAVFKKSVCKTANARD